MRIRDISGSSSTISTAFSPLWAVTTSTRCFSNILTVDIARRASSSTKSIFSDIRYPLIIGLYQKYKNYYKEYNGLQWRIEFFSIIYYPNFCSLNDWMKRF